MKRCKHLNGELAEMGVVGHFRRVEAGVMDSEGPSEVGQITGYQYKCFDCGRVFKARSSNDRQAPLWLRKHIAAL